MSGPEDNNDYQSAEDFLSLAAESALDDELTKVPGFMTDYNLRVAQIRSTMALAQEVGTLTNLLASQHEAREDAGGQTALQRIADTLDRMDRKNL